MYEVHKPQHDFLTEQCVDKRVVRKTFGLFLVGPTCGEQTTLRQIMQTKKGDTLVAKMTSQPVKNAWIHPNPWTLSAPSL